jgi:hypothetical protein
MAFFFRGKDGENDFSPWSSLSLLSFSLSSKTSIILIRSSAVRSKVSTIPRFFAAAFGSGLAPIKRSRFFDWRYMPFNWLPFPVSCELTISYYEKSLSVDVFTFPFPYDPLGLPFTCILRGSWARSIAFEKGCVPLISLIKNQWGSKLSDRKISPFSKRFCAVYMHKRPITE